MKGITDIHSHILYRVDDGSDSIETSMDILKQEYEQGVSNVILTPHFHIGECMPDIEVVTEYFYRLKEKAEKAYQGMTVFLGNEIMACNDMVDMLEQGKLLTLAGSRYVLVEFYPSVLYSAMERSISNILNGGYIPIVAHCERYNSLKTRFKGINYNNIRHLVEMGAYMQVNTKSVFGRDKKFISKLIDNDLLHFVASDAHNVSTRGVCWKACVEYLQKKYSSDYIHWLLVDNPRKILQGEYI